AFLVTTMLLNLVTHFMLVKHIPLHRYQMEWANWDAITVFIVVLLIVLFITLADPVIRLIRLELRFKGKQEEVILQAKGDALDSDQIQSAMANRANFEAGQLAQKIEGEARLRPRVGYGSQVNDEQRRSAGAPNCAVDS